MSRRRPMSRSLWVWGLLVAGGGLPGGGEARGGEDLVRVDGPAEVCLTLYRNRMTEEEVQGLRLVNYLDGRPDPDARPHARVPEPHPPGDITSRIGVLGEETFTICGRVGRLGRLYLAGVPESARSLPASPTQEAPPTHPRMVEPREPLEESRLTPVPTQRFGLVEAAAVAAEIRALPPAPPRSVLFDSARGQGSGDLFEVPLHGGAVRNLTLSGRQGEHSATVSPNGDLLAFVVSSLNGSSNIYVMDRARGRLVAELGKRPFRDPVFTPDGRTLVVATREGPRRGDLYLVGAAGEGTARLTETGTARELEPAFSGDGRWIAYTEMASRREAAVVVTAYQGTDPLPPGRRLAAPGAHRRHPAVTWDGSAVIFASDEAGGWDLFRADLAEETVVNLTRTPEVRETEPVLSGDGRWIAFTAQEGRQRPAVWVARLREDGLEIRQRLTGERPRRSPAFAP